MSEVIVITSGKRRRVGKTTTTANIGAGLAVLGKKVLVIDTDLGLRNLDVVMGLEKPYHLQSGGCDRRKLPIKAGTDQRQPFCIAVSSFLPRRQKDKSRLTGADAKAC